MLPKAESSHSMKSSKRQNLTGKRFGQLTVLEYDTEKQKWKCQCDCGNVTYKTTGHLNSNAVSCGCSQKQDLIGKYQAQIVFQKKRYYLGRYSRLEDAIEIRRKAEARVEEYVEEYLSGNPTPSVNFDF